MAEGPEDGGGAPAPLGEPVAPTERPAPEPVAETPPAPASETVPPDSDEEPLEVDPVAELSRLARVSAAKKRRTFPSLWPHYRRGVVLAAVVFCLCGAAGWWAQLQVWREVVLQLPGTSLESRWQSRHVRPICDTLARDPVVWRRQRALELLEDLEFGEPGVLDALFHALADPDPAIEAGARDAIFTLRGADLAKRERVRKWMEAIPREAWLEVFRRVTNPGVRDAILRQIWHLPNDSFLTVAGWSLAHDPVPASTREFFTVVASYLPSMRGRERALTPEQSGLADLLRAGLDNPNAEVRDNCRSRLLTAAHGRVTVEEAVLWIGDSRDPETVVEAVREVQRMQSEAWAEPLQRRLATETDLDTATAIAREVPDLVRPDRLAAFAEDVQTNPKQEIRDVYRHYFTPETEPPEEVPDGR